MGEATHFERVTSTAVFRWQVAGNPGAALNLHAAETPVRTSIGL